MLAAAENLWTEGAEPLCLLTDRLEDGFFLDYTDPDQMLGADEYELFRWGAFTQ